MSKKISKSKKDSARKQKKELIRLNENKKLEVADREVTTTESSIALSYLGFTSLLGALNLYILIKNPTWKKNSKGEDKFKYPSWFVVANLLPFLTLGIYPFYSLFKLLWDRPKQSQSQPQSSQTQN